MQPLQGVVGVEAEFVHGAEGGDRSAELAVLTGLAEAIAAASAQ